MSRRGDRHPDHQGRGPADVVPGLSCIELEDILAEDERAYVRACTYAPMLRVTCLLDRPLEVARSRIGPPVYAPARARARGRST